MKYNIGIVGATGLVGRKVLQILQERKLISNNIFLFASSKSKGKKIAVGNKKIMVEETSEKSLLDKNLHFALFCTGENVSNQFVKTLAVSGCKVIDFSSLYRKDFPLIVPEINFERCKGNLICNPNCSTIAGVMTLHEVHKKFGLKRIVYSTYQAVSGAGAIALNEINESDKSKLKKLDYPIRNNVIPYIGNINATGFCREEEKMIFETKKILDDFEIKISATTVRVPIDVGHSIAICFETKEKANIEDVKQLLEASEGVKYISSPMPILSRNQDYVLVGRLRKDEFNDKSFSMFVSSDNLRKGAAQNGVQILEKLIEGNL